MGPKVEEFEQEMAAYVGVKYAVAVANGTVALDLALKAVGVGPGDEVIVPAMTYFATASAVSYQYATPVFCDIEEETNNLDPAKVGDLITGKTKALIFIDYGGNPAKIDDILTVARNFGLKVVHDGAQSLGGEYSGRMSGSLAPVATLSFHAAKVMTTVEGGMLLSNDAEFADDLRCRRNQGEYERGSYRHLLLGTNARMSDIHAAIGLVQLRKLSGFLRRRQEIARMYDAFFSSAAQVELVKHYRAHAVNANFFYPIFVANRDRLAARLREEFSIDTRIAYPAPVYRQPLYAARGLPFRKGHCPVAEDFASRVLNLPIYPTMRDEAVAYVAEAVLSLARQT